MVHDSTRSDNWFHDTMVEFSIIGLDLHLFEQPKWRERLENIEPSYYYEGYDEKGNLIKKDYNVDKLTHLERWVRSVEKQAGILKKRFTEMLAFDNYDISKKIITPEEYAYTQEWHNKAIALVDAITKGFRGFRAHKSLGVEEYGILYDHLGKLIDELREHIRDRYLFECEVERRELELDRNKEIEESIGT